METIILASNNKNKIKEIKQMFKKFNVVTMEEIGFVKDIEETGKTAHENSLIKARAVANYLEENHLSYLVMADDSGLFVEALNGEPGVHSARYAGDHNNKANRAKILKNLEDKTNRNAEFLCVVTVIKPNGKVLIGEGRVKGTILYEEQGSLGFGYDCIFYCTELKKSFGLCSEEEKNSVSHRFRALKEILKKL